MKIDNYTPYLETFLFKREWAEIFKELTDEEAGRLIKSLYLFTEGENQPPADIKTRVIYHTIAKQLNNSAYNYLRKTGKLKYDPSES